MSKVFFKSWLPTSILHKLVLIAFVIALIMGCAEISKNDVEEVVFSYQSYTNELSNESAKIFDKTTLTPTESSDLVFFKGTIWTEIAITNNSSEHKSIVIANNDKLNHNYSIYKREESSEKMILISGVTDFGDGRTFNFTKVNFRIDLDPNSHNYYYIHSTSDGRIVQSTPYITSIDNYLQMINRDNYKNVFFYGALFVVFIINFFFWRTFKNKIHGFYSLYILFTIILFTGFDGYLYDQGLSGHLIDHLIFIALRGVVIFMIFFTTYFLKINRIAPVFYYWMKRATVLTVTLMTAYQLLFFDSSISQLHKFENILTVGWMILVLVMLVISVKQKRPEFKYYIIALLFYLVFVVAGLLSNIVTVFDQFQIEFNTLYKVGVTLEVIIFTYTIIAVLKLNEKLTTEKLTKQEDVENEIEVLKAQIQEVNSEKMEFSSVLKLIETNLNDEEKWLAFTEKVNEVNPGFLSNLKEGYPKLTKNDLRLLLLVKIGFTQKEMARMLFIEEASVKKSKQRVRKKLTLPTEVTLADFLSNL